MSDIGISRPQRVSLTRQCLRSIRQYISLHALAPGERLPSQQEWADLLGVSILVVREAFQALQVLGLVDIQHGRGMFVSSLPGGDLLAHLGSPDGYSHREVVEARAMLELAVLESCILRATDNDIARLEEAMEQLRRANARPGHSSEEHERFHRLMLEASGNRLMMSVGLPLLNTFWTLGNHAGFVQESVARTYDMIGAHQAYLDAIRERDLSHTRELVDRHLLGMCSQYKAFPCTAR